MIVMPAWPPRPAICLDCRTLQPAADRCLASAHHRVADLTSRAGRAALLERAWGSPSVRRRIRTAAKVGSTGGATGGGLQACNACDGCSAIDAGGSLGEIVAVIMIVAFAFIAVYLLAIGVRALWRWWRRPPPVRPHGAEARGLAVGRFAGRAGTVVARGTAPAAIGDAPCVAYALQAVYRDRGERVMLRDSVGVGFDVVLDDGAVVAIPAGPLALDVDGAPARAVALTFAAHLDAIERCARTNAQPRRTTDRLRRQVLIRNDLDRQHRGALCEPPRHIGDELVGGHTLRLGRKRRRRITKSTRDVLGEVEIARVGVESGGRRPAVNSDRVLVKSLCPDREKHRVRGDVALADRSQPAIQNMIACELFREALQRVDVLLGLPSIDAVHRRGQLLEPRRKELALDLSRPCDQVE